MERKSSQHCYIPSDRPSPFFLDTHSVAAHVTYRPFSYKAYSIIRSSSSSLIRTWSAWPFVVEIVPPSPHLLPIDCSHRPLHTPLGPFLSDSADVSRWGLRPRQRPRAGVNAAVGPGARTHPQVRSATKGRRRGPKKSMWAIIMGSLLYVFPSFFSFTLTLNPLLAREMGPSLYNLVSGSPCRESWCSNSEDPFAYYS